MLLRNYLKSCLPRYPALKPVSSEVLSQSQYAIHSKKKQEQKQKKRDKKIKNKQKTLKRMRQLCIIMSTSNAFFKNIFPADTQLLKKRQFNPLSQSEYATFLKHCLKFQCLFGSYQTDLMIWKRLINILQNFKDLEKNWKSFFGVWIV